MNFILGFLKALSWIDLAALSSSLLWIIVTLLPNLVKYIASSTAVSPPPTTYISKSSKKDPSQVAQYETPFPINSFSPGQPIGLDDAPVATITAFDLYTSFLPFNCFIDPCKSTDSISSYTNSAPKCFAWLYILSINVGPDSPSTHPG